MKKVVSVLLIAAMCLSFAACGKKEEKKKKKDRDRDRDEDETYETVITDETTEDTPIVIDETEPAKSDKELPIGGICSSVSEGRFWVTYANEDKVYKGLADVDGNILFSEQDSSYDTICSDMKGGAACLVLNSLTVSDSQDIIIVGADGTEIKRFTSTEEAKYKIFGADKGIFLIYENNSGFGGVSNKINVVNAKGEITASYDFGQNRPDSRYVFKATDGVLWYKDLQNRKIYVFQPGVPQVVCAEYEPGKNFYFVEGNLIANYIENNEYFTRVTPIKTYSSDADLAQALKDVQSVQDIDPKDRFTFAYCDRGYIYFLSNGEFGWSNTKIYDLKNSKWVKFPEYPSGVSMTSAKLDNGYAYYTMLGADSKDYYVVADTDGKPLFEPKLYDSGFAPVYIDNGNMVCNNGVILTTGEAVTYDKLPAGFQFTYTHIFAQINAYSCGIYKHYYGGVSEGYYIPFETSGNYPMELRSVDGSKVINTVKVK